MTVIPTKGIVAGSGTEPVTIKLSRSADELLLLKSVSAKMKSKTAVVASEPGQEASRIERLNALVWPNASFDMSRFQKHIKGNGSSGFSLFS